MKRRSLLARCLFAWTFALFVASPNRARADDDAAASAARLKAAGNQSMIDMRYTDALKSYEDALAANPSDVTLLYNITRAHELLGEYPEAVASLERFVKEAPPDVQKRVGNLDALLVELRGRVASLSITCNVDGARILLRNKVVGTTPLKTPLRVNAGGATIEIDLEGFFPAHRDVVLPGNGALSVEMPLEKKSTSGIVLVKTDPSGARVSVDGKAEGTSSPALELALAAGSHKILAQREGYDDALVPIVVEPGKSRDVSLALDKSVPVYQRWWFWTGVGVVIAGGVAGAIAATTEKSPTKGTLAPGQVSSGTTALIRF